jgi:hypothetical protein
MIKQKLSFSWQTAHKLMAVARNQGLKNYAHAHKLPLHGAPYTNAPNSTKKLGDGTLQKLRNTARQFWGLAASGQTD